MFEFSEEIRFGLARAIADLKDSHKDEPSNTRAKLAFEFDGLPIYVDMGAAVILFPSGELLTLPHDAESLVPTESPFNIVSLVVGAKRFPWLQELLPVRASSANDCSVCEGAGRLALGSVANESPFVCGTCFGLGWVHDS